MHLRTLAPAAALLATVALAACGGDGGQSPGARFIGGVMTSSEHGALQQQLEGMGALSVNHLGKDEALSGAQCSRNAFSTVQSTIMDVRAIADMVGDLPAKRFAGVEKAGSIDPAKVREALEGLEFDSIEGRVRMRPEDHMLERPSHVARIARKKGGIGGLGWEDVTTTPASVTTPRPNPACKL